MSAISRVAFAVLFLALLFAVACGGGSGDSTVVPPVFSLTTPGAASEGTPFTYTLQATASQGQTVSYALVSGPTGAMLSGATISWTPTHAQSRKANDFTVKATSSSGGTATTSFSIMPAGTIHGSEIDTYWSGGQGTQLPMDFSRARSFPSALVPDGTGALTNYAGQGFSDGTFTIANVPAGSYWLKFGPAMYWTDTSDIDMGRDIAGRPRSTTYQPPSAPVTANLDISGLDPWNASFTSTGALESSTLSGFSPEALTALSFTESCTSTPNLTSCGSNNALGVIPSGTTSFTGQLPLSATTPVEPSLGDSAYFFEAGIAWPQGSEMGVSRITKVLGPLALTLDSNVTSVNVSGQFTASPQGTMRLKVRGSGFASSVTGTNPSAVADNVFDGFNVLVYSAFVPDRYAPASSLLPLGLDVPFPMSRFSDPGVTLVSAHTNGLPSDYDGGDVTFASPLPNPELVYRAEQNANVLIAQNGGMSSYYSGVTGYYTTHPPSADAPFDPPMLNVQNPQINSTGLFQATNATQPITLSWQPPTGAAPSGYIISAASYSPCTVTSSSVSCTGAVSFGTLYTSETSVTFPPGLLTDGQAYSFTIHALADKATNFKSAPNRGSWDRAYSDVISNIITVGATTSTAARVVTTATATETNQKRTQLIRVVDGVLRQVCYSDGKLTDGPCVQ